MYGSIDRRYEQHRSTAVATDKFAAKRYRVDPLVQRRQFVLANQPVGIGMQTGPRLAAEHNYLNLRHMAGSGFHLNYPAFSAGRYPNLLVQRPRDWVSAPFLSRPGARPLPFGTS